MRGTITIHTHSQATMEILKMDHAFTGTRFPWNQKRMEFILNELITKHEKYKTFSKLVEVYIILAEKIGATPRIVENFVKNLGRDFRDLLKVNPNIDRDKAKLRGSNKIFKLYEEYYMLYFEGISSRARSDYEADDGADSEVDIVEMKFEPDDLDSEAPQIVSVVSVSASDGSLEEHRSPTPPPVPRKKKHKSLGRRGIGLVPTHVTVDAANLVEFEDPKPSAVYHTRPTTSSEQGRQDPARSTPTQVQSDLRSVPNASSPVDVTNMPPLAPIEHPPIPPFSHQTLPARFLQNNSSAAGNFTLHSSGLEYAVPDTSGKRPAYASADPGTPSAKKSRKTSIPLVSENLPDGMTEFERRYLQGMDTQNRMLFDIGRELKLLRTGFFAIHSDDIADMVNPNVH
ncbi:uncharacterized protein [Diadema setosum]|uniref:uncharacterized protein n=1 Tax=Diadema setosum TaxID=31175 RepID=UPI003B3B5B20